MDYVTEAAYCNILKEVMDPLLEDIALSFLTTLVFIHVNSLSHSARVTQIFLVSYGIKGERVMM